MSTTPDRKTPERRPDAPECAQQATGPQMPEYDAQGRTAGRTAAEWEIVNLEWAAQNLGDAWTAMIRAMGRDTHQTPGEYRTTIAAIRDATDRVERMVKDRGGMV